MLGDCSVTTRIQSVPVWPNPFQPKFHFKASASRATQASKAGERQTRRSTRHAEASASAFVARKSSAVSLCLRKAVASCVL